MILRKVISMNEVVLLPADSYIVINKTIIASEDRKILNMLYMPIIGPIPVILYFSLWDDLDKSEVMSAWYNHHHLTSIMHLSLEEILEARHKLEAIGLLKTYVKKDQINNYIYELYSPLSAHEFFTHPILNIVLYNNIGKQEYDKLINYFKIPNIKLNNYSDITKNFNEIFTSVPLTSSEVIQDDIRKYRKLKLNINDYFDMSFLEESLPNNVLSKDLKELIINLSYIYDIDASKMTNIIKTCFTEKGTISKEELRKSVRNYYQFDNNGLLPTVVDNTQPEYLRKPIGDTSKKARMIYFFETTSPYNFLKLRNNNSEPIKRDLKLVEDLIVDYGLKPGVVNVLIDYTLKVNDKKLTRNYIETIAGWWKRYNIETVEDAMTLAEKEHKKYNKKDKTTNAKYTKKEEKTTKVPEWFDKEIKVENTNAEEEQELQELLKEYQ